MDYSYSKRGIPDSSEGSPVMVLPSGGQEDQNMVWYSLSQGLLLVEVGEYYLSDLSRQSLMKLIISDS